MLGAAISRRAAAWRLFRRRHAGGGVAACRKNAPQAIGQVMIGLTAATIIGVPCANLVGQAVGWRCEFRHRGGAGVDHGPAVRAVRAARCGRPVPTRCASSVRSETAASGSRWRSAPSALAACSPLYTYLATTLIEVTKVSPAVIPFFLAVFGIGATLGNLFVPRFADRALMPTAGVILLFAAVALLVFPLAAGNPWLLAADVFAIGAERLARRRPADAADGRRGRRAGARCCAQPFGVQHRQCARPVPGWHRHSRGAGLDLHRPRRRRARASGLPDLDRRRARRQVCTGRGHLEQARRPAGERPARAGAAAGAG